MLILDFVEMNSRISFKVISLGTLNLNENFSFFDKFSTSSISIIEGAIPKPV
jgi:hypothetical protein